MPLAAQVVRDGEPLDLRWGWWHLNTMFNACALDAGLITRTDIEDESNPLPYAWSDTELDKMGTYELKAPQTWTDPSDGEVLELKAGDVFRVWREYK